MKKCPIDILGTRPISFVATYTKSPIIHISFKGKEKSPKMNKGDEFWLPEKYRLVNDMIQYLSDYSYQKDTPKWIESSKMKKDFSRYSIVVISAKLSKLRDVDKKQSVMFGIPPRHLPYKVAPEKPKTFKKSEEVWRLKEFMNTMYDGEDCWDDNSEVWVYEYTLRRNKAKYPNFLDKNLFGVLK